MEYIVVFDPEEKSPSLMENKNNFIAPFATFDLAKAEGELWKREGDCKDYAIYLKCTDL